MMSDLYFNEESNYCEENTYDNKVFRSTIFQPFQSEPEPKRKKLNIFTLQQPIYY